MSALRRARGTGPGSGSGDRPVVVFVAGAMRSGTTIIGQVLASSPAALLVGEVRSVIIDPHLHTFCDCGRPRTECPYWTGPDAGGPSAEVARRATSMTALPALLASVALGRPLTAPIAEVAAYLTRCLERAGDTVLVDTSKTPALIPLWRLAGARPHVVLAVRHPWHVAKAQARPTEVTGVPQRPVGLSLAVWAAYQAGSLVVLPLASAGFTLSRFRAFLARPTDVVDRVWSRAGLPPGEPGPDGSYAFEPSHVLAGNPRRARGTVTIRAQQ